MPARAASAANAALVLSPPRHSLPASARARKMTFFHFSKLIQLEFIMEAEESIVRVKKPVTPPPLPLFIELNFNLVFCLFF